MLYREVVLSASFRSQLQQSSACFFYLGFFLQGVEQASAGAGGQAGEDGGGPGEAEEEGGRTEGGGRLAKGGEGEAGL